MNLNNVLVADIECRGLLDDLHGPEDFHVLSVGWKSGGEWKIKSTNKEEDVRKLFGNPENTIVMHNGIRYDKKAIEKMFGFKVEAVIIDSLSISQYLYNALKQHGLAHWGEFFSVPKPKIEDWNNLTYDEYKFRCQEDVSINILLWEMQLEYLRNIYEDDAKIVPVIKYLNHKMDMLAMQEENPILIDIEQCKLNAAYLEEVIAEKEIILNKLLPKVPTYAIRKKPKVFFTKDGSLSKAGIKWLELVKACGLEEDYDGEIKVITEYKEPNCQSSTQMKDFLLSKGWKPTIFKDGANGKVPQLRDDNKELCPNIKKLIEVYPELSALSGLSVAQHRLGYLKSMLTNANSEGYARATANGYTRTLRLKHSAPFVNLPKPNAEHGSLIRSVMVAPPGYVCIGADLSSIEDKCKQISIYPLDRAYVESMNTKGWDAHLSLGQKAGVFTEDDVQFYKWYNNKDKGESVYTCPEDYLSMSEEEMHDYFEVLAKKRAISKTANYGLTYGCGVPKLMESTGLDKKSAENLHKGYHDLNWSVKAYADSRYIKKVQGTNWVVLNKKAGGIQKIDSHDWMWSEPSKMFLPLVNAKDVFSGCNQHHGVKIFDTWSWFLMSKGIKFSYQAHDEQMWYCKEEDVDKHIEIIEYAIKKVNEIFNPPIPIECDYKVGKTYAEVH